MILYLVIIAIAVLAIAAVVSLAASTAFFPVLGWTALATAAVILVDALTATICRLLPAKCANPEKKIFQVSAKEKKFYEKLKIRKWKDRVPEIGQFTGFRKNKIVDPKSVEYLERFLLEACYGEIGHIVSCITSYLILLLFPLYELWFAVAIPVATVSLLLNIPSFCILRYNSYKLRVLRDSNLKKQRRQQSATQEN
ncbi:MAG: hypothetical protein J6K86_01695 [Clostridia bacterium]|nr:hypothetical protein [Clostridia bacterium]